jgi:hypothetical protein
MAMRVSVRFDPQTFRRELAIDKDRLRNIVRAGFSRTADQIKETLRGEVRKAGLGDRLANAVRVDLYPWRGRSLRPAIYVYTASALLDWFHEGGLIRGTPWLAIPTPEAEQRGYAESSLSRNRTVVPGGQKRRVARMDRADNDFDLQTRLLPNGNLLVIGVPKHRQFRRGRPRGSRNGVPPAARGSVRGVPLFVLVRAARVPVLLSFARHHDAFVRLLADNINRGQAALVTV